ncbi:glycosyltransferase (activator-dependent family) [Saccharothrix tamanrassetensis]|uniref:Glycosyltransferase (Activator-dependent family) n=1 Tax=Saccharothrix tamanrassetensis TaxID=1051531 RepID=A0A841CJ81_9PSEU|nr:activator-dependent family glycosyltransferase [Saccharothrix tamanrassetensis]MBB5958532.1 glycosyltransferase (activator-dependent family) [Saccharothrix tamanrassetensis]
MRVLFVASAEKTIFLSMVPLAWALRTAGHEVRVAGKPAFADTITQAGLTAVPVGRDTDTARRTETEEQVELARKGLHPPWDCVEDDEFIQWDRMVQGHVEVVDKCHHLENFPIIASLVDFARSWQPDLVVWDPLAYAGAIAAKAVGAAHARVLFGIDVWGATRDHFLRLKADQPPSRRADPLAEWLGAYSGKYGLEFSEDMTTGHFTIDQLPASLQLATSQEVVRTRFVPYGGPAVVPKWLWTAPERPRVALTLGTTATEYFDGYTLDIQDVIDSVAELDVELVATIAEAEQKKLKNVPDNVRLVSYVPLHALAPTCSAVINHAGFGTLSTFAMHGVPQLTLPYHFDEPLFARKYAEQGAGLRIHAVRPTGRKIRHGVQRLLNEPRFGERAAALHAEIREMPTPNQFVAQLEELTAKYRTGG